MLLSLGADKTSLSKGLIKEQINGLWSIYPVALEDKSVSWTWQVFNLFFT